MGVPPVYFLAEEKGPPLITDAPVFSGGPLLFRQTC